VNIFVLSPYCIGATISSAKHPTTSKNTSNFHTLLHLDQRPHLNQPYLGSLMLLEDECAHKLVERVELKLPIPPNLKLQDPRWNFSLQNYSLYATAMEVWENGSIYAPTSQQLLILCNNFMLSRETPIMTRAGPEILEARGKIII
jgi:hypothetical protein